jgi:DnaJ-class molecular chaperone
MHIILWQESPYDILAIPQTATIAEIKIAYHQMASACSDMDPGNPKAIKRCHCNIALVNWYQW